MNNVDNPFQSPTILSLCTGMRGLEIGIERVLGDVRVAAFLEIEAFVCENLVQQMEQGVLAPSLIFTDLKTFPYKAFDGKIHGIVGGYPCQGFSHAGLRKGADDPRHLWPFIRRGIKESRPSWVFFENVEGHLSLGLRDVLTDLRKLGYQVEGGLFSAAEVGAPHRRNRVFILGLENSFVIRMRGWSDEQRENWRRQIQTPRSGELADSDIGRFDDIPGGHEASGQGVGVQERDDFQESGKSGELADAGLLGSTERQEYSEGTQQYRQRSVDNTGGHGLEPEYEISAGRNGAELAGEAEGMADSTGSGKRGGSGNVHQADGGSDGELSFESDGAGVGDTEHPGSQKENGLRKSTEPAESGMADAQIIGVEGNGTEGIGVTEISSGEAISGCDSGGDRWPARPGEPQFEWEAPRLKRFMGSSTSRNPDSVCDIHLAYEIYSANKVSTIKALHELWCRIDKEANASQSVRGLFSILKEEVLWSPMLSQFTPQRLTIFADAQENFASIHEIKVRTLRDFGDAWYSSYRQECIEQLRKEFANAMCILSYEIALARRQESPFGDYHQTLQNLWKDLPDAWRDAPEALSEIQKAWESVSQKSDRKGQVLAAYKSYRLEFNGEHREDLLRMAGNAVVAPQSERAFRTLILKFIK